MNTNELSPSYRSKRWGASLLVSADTHRIYGRKRMSMNLV